MRDWLNVGEFTEDIVTTFHGSLASSRDVRSETHTRRDHVASGIHGFFADDQVDPKV